MPTKSIFLCLLLLGPLFSLAQPVKPDCQQMLEEGDHLAAGDSPNWEKVLTEYLSALNCDAALASELGPKIQGVFAKIEAQKQEAISQRRRAEQQTRVAIRERDRANQRTTEATAFTLAVTARSLLEEDATKALNLSYEAFQLSPQPQVIETFQTVTEPSHSFYRQRTEWGEGIESVDLKQTGDRRLLSIEYRAQDTYWPERKIFDLTTGDSLDWEHEQAPEQVLLFDRTGKIALTHIDYEITWYGADHPNGTKIIAGINGRHPYITAVSREGTHLLVGFSNEERSEASLELWNLQTSPPTLVLPILELESPPSNLAIADRGNTFVLVLPDSTLRYWTDGQSLPLRTLPETGGPVERLALAPAGDRLMTSGPDAQIRMWDLAQAKLTATFGGHDAPLNSLSFSAEGQRILSCDPVTGALLRSTDAPQDLLRRFPPVRTEQLQGAYLSDNGSVIYTVGYLPYLEIGGTQFSVIENTGVLSLTTWPTTSATAVHTNPASENIALLPTGDRYATVREGGVELWTFGDTTATFTLPESDGATAIAVSRDGRHLAWGNARGSVTLYSLTDRAPLSTFAAFGAEIYHLHFSPDGHLLIAGGGEHDVGVTVWSLKQKQAPVQLTSLDIQAGELAFSPDGKLLLASATNWAPVLYRISSGSISTGPATESLGDLFANPVFSADGKFFAGTIRPDFERGDSLRIWDTRTQQLAGIIQGDHLSGQRLNIVSGIDFSPDGRFLLSGGWDGTLKLWHLPTGRLLQTFVHHDYEYVKQLGFSQNGRLLFSRGEDGTVKLWHNLFAAWDTRIYRLSDAELAQYLPYEISRTRETPGTPIAAVRSEIAPTNKKYAIQVGVFQTTQADIMLAKMIELGYSDAYISEYTNELGNTFRRVIAAVYDDRATARRELIPMQREYDIKEVIIRPLEDK